ncbi:DNA helicase MCM8 [Pseudolycoriella hygida]|uniref:DNA helicase MCM8 n=1 Tax=Pseudolycoriella hygida TaxID=35572 RepID=A0A9Q0S532_9DIPT|nr:DNA helicase MCM8 [Pseudolycoriella hygida]
MSTPRPQRGNSRGRARWTPYNYRRTSNIRHSKPISVQISHSNSADETSSGQSSGQPVVGRPLSVSTTQFSGWNLYFPEEVYSEDSNIVRKIKSFEKHIATNPTQYDLEETRKKLWFTVATSTVTRDKEFMLKWPTFEQDLLDNPEETLNCLGLGMHQQLLDAPIVPNSTQTDLSTNKDFNLQQVHARIQTNFKTVNLNSVKVDRNGKLLVVRGNVVRIGTPEYRAKWITYRCTQCNAEQAIKQNKQIKTTPQYCPCKNRSSYNFVALESSPFTSIEKCQTIYLQEIRFSNQSGRVPRTIKIILAADLVDSVYPGDDVTVNAIVQCPTQDENHKIGIAPIRAMYLKAVSISSNRNVSITWKNSFTEKDLGAIRAIKSQPCPFRLLVHSLSPMIYGHEMIKAGLVLALLGGSDHPTRRSQCHILIVGDPGLGKSQMLQSCADASPKGIFVCGKTSSTAGLTVSIHHEKGHDTSLAAGPLLLADQGTCCIDEMDKMSNSNQALLEVMEQQFVSIAKAGVFCSLPARTSVLAAANPAGGHYNKSKTVAENVKINPALLSRFDLVFIILDRPNADLDSMLYDHRRTLRDMPQVLMSNNSFSGTHQSNDDQTSEPLNVRLKLRRNETINHLPHLLMQTYIAYARKNCHPTLSQEAVDLLRTFYLELRGVQQGSNSIPVTIRQMEAMIRLTQARARAELCDKATAQHANDIITIVRHSLIDVFSTDSSIQLQRSVNGSGMSQTGQIRQFVRILQMKTAQLQKSIFSISELKEMSEIANLKFVSFADTIETMNIQGFLLKKGTNLYKFLSE